MFNLLSVTKPPHPSPQQTRWLHGHLLPLCIKYLAIWNYSVGHYHTLGTQNPGFFSPALSFRFKFLEMLTLILKMPWQSFCKGSQRQRKHFSPKQCINKMLIQLRNNAFNPTSSIIWGSLHLASFPAKSCTPKLANTSINVRRRIDTCVNNRKTIFWMLFPQKRSTQALARKSACTCKWFRTREQKDQPQ